MLQACYLALARTQCAVLCPSVSATLGAPYLCNRLEIFLMAFLALGINHNTATLEVRENLAFSAPEVVAALRCALSSGIAEEIALLSTCNRTELYCYSSASRVELLSWLAQQKNIDLARIESACYFYRDDEAVQHVMRVACGLDSMVLGEPQILGQVKTSYALAQEHEGVGSRLHSTFQQVFSIAKRVRTETSIGAYPVSVAYAAVSLARQIFSNLADDTAMLIGAGETIELVAQHLKEQGTRKIIVANRSLDNAKKLALQYGAEAILLNQIPERLHEADIVISSTASPLPLLGKGTVEAALRKRRNKPMFIVDIAVPRDVEAQVGELNDVFLYTVDDLKEVIDGNQRSRESAAMVAQEIILEGVEKHEHERRSLGSVDTIRAFREYVNTIREDELDKAKRMLESGKSPEEALESLASKLANKFMHAPTQGIKEAAAEKDNFLLGSIRKLFPINKD
ncbi:MAG: glutamyl-tRNA reductase [Flavobacteriales bacterium]|jgi:glutamyl-tRNA reductase